MHGNCPKYNGNQQTIKRTSAPSRYDSDVCKQGMKALDLHNYYWDRLADNCESMEVILTGPGRSALVGRN